MTAVSPVTSVEAFLSALEKSGVVSSAGMPAVREAVAKTSDPKQLARELIKDGTLTKWQAGQLLHNFHALIVGKYELLDQLGAGELGRVYLVQQIETKSRHALKVLSKKHAGDPERVKRFLADVQLARKLEHQNLVRLEEISADGDRCSVLMEFIDGQDLQRTVEGGGRPPIGQALELVRQMAEGLAYAHERGLIHGDLRPSNILVDGAGTVKILDFGQRHLKLNALSDLDSVGMVLCYLLTGTSPASSAEAGRLLSESAGIPEEVRALGQRLISELPGKRLESMSELLTQLDLAIWQASSPAADSDSAGNDSATFFDEAPVEQIEQKPKAARAVAKGPGERTPTIAAQSDRTFDKGLASGGDSSSTGDAPTVSLVSSIEPESMETPEEGAAPASGHRTMIIGAAAASVVLLVAGAVAGARLLRPARKDNSVKPAQALVVAEAPVREPLPDDAPASAAIASPAESSAQSVVGGQPPPGTPAPPSVEMPPADPSTAATRAETKTTESPPPPAKPETKAEQKPEAKPAAKPAAPPKPPPKPNPFQGFAKAVALPELPQTASDQASQVLEPITLGSCKIDDKTQMAVRLKGGSTVFRGGKQVFDLQPIEGPVPREWEFQFKSGEATTAIARLTATGGKLDYRWTEEGVKQAATAHLLCNCAVELSANGFQHTFNLRQPANGPPLAISIDKGGGTGRWVFDHVPDIKQVFIEATRFDGMRRHVVEPPEPISPGDDLTVWTGPRDDALFLGLKFASATMAKGVRMSVTVQVKQEGSERALPYNKKEVANRIDKMNQERTMLSGQLQEASKPPPPGIDRAKLDALKTQLKQEVDLRTKRIGQVETLSKYVTDVQGAVAVHFRVFYQADDRQVDLFIAGDPPPPPRPAPRPQPPPAPKAAEAIK